MSFSGISLSNSFELENEFEDVVPRGALVYAGEPPIRRNVLKRHAEERGYAFNEVEDQDTFFVTQSPDYDDEFISWRMAYGVREVDLQESEKNCYLVWLAYRPAENTDRHDASKPWTYIIEKLGGKKND